MVGDCTEPARVIITLLDLEQSLALFVSFDLLIAEILHQLNRLVVHLFLNILYIAIEEVFFA